MADRTTRSCAFTTDRLDVGPWHDLAGRHGIDLAATVSTVLTPTTTAALPPGWQGDLDHDRARAWIEGRDAESPTLLVVERAGRSAIGLLVLFEGAIGHRGAGATRIDLRLGYVFRESAWRQGFASELVEGVVTWATGQPAIATISGGVAAGNAASAAVLTKNGFTLTESGDDEHLFTLTIR